MIEINKSREYQPKLIKSASFPDVGAAFWQTVRPPDAPVYWSSRMVSG
jgi:hypothetical protein